MTTPKPFVFVLMPFADEFDDIYKLGIKPACVEAGAYAERSDEQIFEGSILEQVYNQISKADIIVADMTGRNPNVFYEVGYAHALGKRVILLTQIEKDIPFDLLHYPHIIYENKIADKLLPELAKRVRFFIENPETEPNIGSLKDQIEIFIDRAKLEGFPTVLPEKIDYGIEGGVTKVNLVHGSHFKIAFHNSLEKYIRNAEYGFGLVTPNTVNHVGLYYKSGAHMESLNKNLLPGNKDLHVYSDEFILRPGAWEGITLRTTYIKNVPCGTVDEYIIRLFTSSGPIEFPFKIKLESKDE